MAVTSAALPRAKLLETKLSVPIKALDKSFVQLLVEEQRLSLQVPDIGKPVFIDFSSGKYDHRRKFGGGKGQPLAKAVGMKQGHTPYIIDATAGFARDAFVLASLGSTVTMLEQSPVISLLIEDALQQEEMDDEVRLITQRMMIHHANAIDFLSTVQERPDVIYMDPMYPSRDKSALVKKEMQALHQLIGPDTDSEELLSVARQVALRRVVVKRPKGAEFVGNQKPSASIQSKNTRYDLYVNS
ncbi:MAG TPA: 16S rRNA methyltransferase [Methylophaga aminisulfidivorans]|nr:16S rRNA methyltransferase [Methylophaga sp.]HIM38530.1 16S rRNA methyltransferase [Methylophaga aminisulfidivorans]